MSERERADEPVDTARSAHIAIRSANHLAGGDNKKNPGSDLPGFSDSSVSRRL